jgi:hypothetical protein
MIERKPGEMTTLDTRGESYDKVDKQKRYQQIIEMMERRELLASAVNGRVPMTAKELAVALCSMGYIPTSERNFTAPRLTEMCKQGVVEPAGKVKCIYTGRKVTAYRLRRE